MPLQKCTCASMMWCSSTRLSMIRDLPLESHMFPLLITVMSTGFLGVVAPRDTWKRFSWCFTLSFLLFKFSLAKGCMESLHMRGRSKAPYQEATKLKFLLTFEHCWAEHVRSVVGLAWVQWTQTWSMGLGLNMAYHSKPALWQPLWAASLNLCGAHLCVIQFIFF